VTQIDLDLLAAWMDEQGLASGPITDVEELGGGTQNILLRFRRGGDSFVLRHPPPHKRDNSDETMRREARVLAALDGTDVPHPRLIAACGDEAVLGSALYLIKPVEGANPTVGLPEAHVDSSEWRHQLGLSMADRAAAIGLVARRQPADVVAARAHPWRLPPRQCALRERPTRAGRDHGPGT
jgi:aminoglycoside phosphotransferase (APT) family kinase protein